MQGTVSLDNSVRVKIYKGETADLDFLVEVGSHSISLGDLSI
jgi:hypothetical protein